MAEEIAITIAISIPDFFITLVIFGILEHYFAHHKEKKIFRRGFLTDFIYFILNKPFGILLNSLLLVSAVNLFWPSNEYYYKFLTDSQLNWPLWIQVPLTLLILDFIFYWEHYWFHKNRFLWRIHTIHHSSLDLDWLSTFRLHVVEMLVFYVLGPFLLLLLGFAPAAFVIGGLIKRFYNPLLHANVPWTFGWIGYVIASPRFHRWHHEISPEAAGKNLATMFSVYDLIFGTYYVPTDRLPENYGIPGERVPNSVLVQLVYPFIPKRFFASSPANRGTE